MPDQEKFIAELWPTTGPHSAESIIAAAVAISELWRYLGHAFQGYAAKIEPLENVSDVYTLVGALTEADMRAADILARLGHWSDYIAARSDPHRGSGYGEYGHTDDDGAPDTVQSTMNTVTRHFRNAASHHVTSAELLNTAHGQLSFIYNKPTD